MQIFLPSENLEENAKILDSLRLNKQVLESYQIWLACKENSSSKWKSHPAIKMWRPYIGALEAYHDFCLEELRNRPTKSGKPRKLVSLAYQELSNGEKFQMPCFMGIEKLHSLHRANLIRKSKETKNIEIKLWYSKFSWTEEPANGYLWWSPEGFILIKNEEYVTRKGTIRLRSLKFPLNFD